jgi:hypothetical protein
MFMGRVVCAVFLMSASMAWTYGQEPARPPTSSSPPAAAPTPAPSSDPSPSQTIALTVPKGAPLQIALDKEVHVRKVGQPIHGRVVQPVYAFDRLVVPVGTEVTGQITKIEDISGKKRTLAILNANLTPSHNIEVKFNDLALADGKHIPLHTVATPGSGQVIQLVSASEDEKKKTVKDAASEKLKEAKQEAKRDWDNAMKQAKEPGKMHRLERYAVAQLPIHPQYIDTGTLYFAELQEPLDFGSEPLTPEAAATIGTPPPPGSLVHALLVTPLNSATTQKGDEVEAVLTQPLFDSGHLILPQGSRLKGSVVQVEAARRLHRNGLLRIVFHELTPPDGIEQKVRASLEGVESGKADHVRLDSEGGARAISPKTRYLSTGLSIALAAASSRVDHDDSDGGVGGTTRDRAAGGAAGFNLVVGIALGVFIHSQPFGMAMGAYGASRQIYVHFVARGRDVVFPKDTAMEIGFGGRTAPAPKPAKAEATPTKQ